MLVFFVLHSVACTQCIEKLKKTEALCFFHIKPEQPKHFCLPECHCNVSSYSINNPRGDGEGFCFKRIMQRCHIHQYSARPA